MWVLFWAVSGGAISILGFLSWRSWNNYQKYKSLRSLPAPTGYPILGNLAQLLSAAKQGRYFTLLSNWAEELGSMYVVWNLGKPGIILSQPKVIEKTIVRGLKDKTLIRDPKQRNIWQDLFGAPVMIQQDGEPWQWRRQTFNQALSTKQIQTYFELVKLACQQVIDTCFESAKDRQAIEVDPMFSQLTMRIICRLLLGIPIDGKSRSIEGPALEPQKMYQALSILVSQFLVKVAAPSKIFQYLPTSTNQKYWAAKKYLENFVESRVDLALQMTRKEVDPDSAKVSPEFARSMLVKFAKQPKFTKQMLCAETIGVIFAGTDTTAHTLSFTVGALGINARVFQTARAEVDRVWDLNNGLNPESLKELNYIQAVIKESMRLYPVSNGSSGCITATDTVIEGIKVPAETQIGWSLIAAGRDPQEYPLPNEFQPERWLKDKEGDSLPTFLVFGSGPHRCWGEALSLLEATVMLAMLIRYFDWEVVNGQDSLENLGQNLTVFPSDRMPIKFTARKFSEQTVIVN